MREKRFIKFASVEYDGQLYMTPQDFLDSVVESEPRREYILEYIFSRILSIDFVVISSDLKCWNFSLKSIKTFRVKIFRVIRRCLVVNYRSFCILFKSRGIDEYKIRV